MAVIIFVNVLKESAMEFSIIKALYVIMAMVPISVRAKQMAQNIEN
jgi:hypothetical protein